MKSLAEKLRSEQCRRILLALDFGSKSMTELSKVTKLTQGSINKHVDVLLLAELVAKNSAGGFSIR